MSLTITATLDQMGLVRADARLAKYEGRPLAKRLQQAYLEGGRVMLPKQRAKMAALGVQRRSGRLYKSISARKPRLRMGEVAAAVVGPRAGRKYAPHRHLIIAGTRPHSLATKRPGKSQYVAFGENQVRRTSDVSHPGSRSFPFVAQTQAEYGPAVVSFIATRARALAGARFTSF